MPLHTQLLSSSHFRAQDIKQTDRQTPKYCQPHILEPKEYSFKCCCCACRQTGRAARSTDTAAIKASAHLACGALSARLCRAHLHHLQSCKWSFVASDKPAMSLQPCLLTLSSCLMPDLRDVLCRLATEALTRGSGDNITVIVAFLKPVDTLESVFRGGKQKHAATPTFYSSRQASSPAQQQLCCNMHTSTLHGMH